MNYQEQIEKNQRLKAEKAKADENKRLNQMTPEQIENFRHVLSIMGVPMVHLMSPEMVQIFRDEIQAKINREAIQR